MINDEIVYHNKFAAIVKTLRLIINTRDERERE